MTEPHIITLNLRTGLPRGRQAEWLQGLIAQALTVVEELIAAESDPEDAQLLTELQATAGLFGPDVATPVPTEAGSNCLERSRAVAHRTRQRRVERRRELAAILNLVRDVVSTAAA
ncbi:MAG: hypothetical protein OEW19_22145, partial [Acidobacteriota bacterium]|nr:hypothetical protein [Acidobacteriota bacterium]